MSKPIRFLIVGMINVMALCLALLLFACPTAAQGTHGHYIFLLAAGFLCEGNDPASCLAAARSSQGDTYEMSGAGTFDVQNKLADAVGTFRHKSPDGILLETGVWFASELVSFNSYGIDPAALPRLGLPPDPDAFGRKRLPTSAGQMPTGGLAVFRVRLLEISGISRTAVLEVNSALGNVPRERSAEGIRLTLGGSGSDYSQETGGRAMFLAIRRGAGPSGKGPQREPGC